MKRRFFVVVFAFPAVFMLSAAAMLGWIAATESGLRFAVRLGEQAMSPHLRIESPTGTLIGAPRVARIVFETPERKLIVEDLELRWQPWRLLDRLLLIERLSIKRLQIASRPSEKPPERPQGVELPIAIRLEQFHIGEIGFAGGESKPGLRVTGIMGRLTSDGGQHRLEELRLAMSRFTVRANGSLRSLPPFPLAASAQISGAERGHPVTVAVDAVGTLENLALKANAASGKLKVDGRAKLDFSAAQPLREGRLVATDLDPAAWLKDAPHARLGIVARLAPAKDTPDAIVGDIAVSNSAPGRLDEERVPLRRLQARLRQRGKRVEVGRFTAAIADGEFNGTALWEQGRLAVDAVAVGIDASAWHKRLAKTRLNGDIAARGRLAEHRAVDLRFALHDSRLAGRLVAGRGSLALRGERLERTDILLQAGDNRLVAHGSLGAPDDTLGISITANRLEDLGLRGSLQGEIKLFGALRLPGVDWNLKSPRFAVPGSLGIREFASEGRLAPKAGAIRANIDVAAVDFEKKGPQLAELSFDIDGLRSEHRLRASAKVGKDYRVAFGASGALDDAQVWKGHIETLEWRGPNAVHLVGTPRLEVGARHVALERAELAGTDWEANMEGLRWESGRLRTAGRFSRLPIRLFLPAAAAGATSLRVGGEWDLDFGRQAAGRVRVFRQEGDIALAAAGRTTAMGLERFSLQADATGHEVELSFAASASQAGTLEGRLAAGLLSEDGRWALARHAPWRGKLDVDLRSLGWVSALAGNAVLIGGKLRGTAHIGGSPAVPALAGEMAGSELRVQVPDHGIDLGGGSLRVQFTPDKVRLQQLELISVATRPPRQGRTDFRRFADRTGRLVAEGDIEPQSGTGRVRLRAEQLAVSELPDRWLMVSGTADLRMTKDRLQVGGNLTADAAYLEIAPADRPKLSQDVVVQGREGKKERRQNLRLGLDVAVDLGDRFYFHGAGIDTRLAGRVRLAATRIDQLRGDGSVRTVEGTFDAYGHELTIERGILNFQGLVTNPGLNVRAMRKNMQVEAGVEVGGTLKNPKVRLVSVPDVPDTEKLSWMVLGRPPGESVGKQDADLLLSAAMALRGSGKQGKGGLQSLTEGLGLEELSLSSGTLGEGRRRFPSSHVAGSFAAGETATAAEQIATVGKRVGSNTVLSYERSINTAESVLKLTVELTRRFSLIGRVGADNAVGFLYSFTFGGESKDAAKQR